MRVGVRGVAASALALAAMAFGGGVAQAQGPVLENGKTKAVYDYTQATRERVFIPQAGIDQDRNGQEDWITIDIIRPKEASTSNKMPAIIDPSPYYTANCRGNEGQCMADFNSDGVNDRWPLFYDNYFLPRGYAYILAQMNGTGYTTNGCPEHGGPGDIAGEKSVVDWLNGRALGFTSASRSSAPKIADWHNGSSAMIGKSYDGTLANGVAATGVEGLKTIVPISAISAWYNYSRTGGIRHNNNYPSGLNSGITYRAGLPGVNLPDRRPICAPVNTDHNAWDGDETGDYNQYWEDRNYNKDVSKVKAAVFAIHGFQDDNVRMDHMGLWWEGLKANNVPRKLWLLRTGHTDPFEQRRAEWVNTLHRWFDHHLYGVANGIMSEPAVTIEDEQDVWKEYGDWPIPGTEGVDVFLRGKADTAEEGTLGGMTGGAADSLTFTNTANFPQESAVINTPEGAQTNRRVFLSQPLTKDVRLSGTAVVDLQATLTTDQANFGAVLVDYGAGTQTSRSGDGIQTGTTRTCWGATGAGDTCAPLGSECTIPDVTIDNACYLEVNKRTDNVTQWRVSRGVLDSRNRSSLWTIEPVTIGAKTQFKFPLQPTEHIFKAGHRIGIAIVGNLYGANASGSIPTAAAAAQPITLDAKLSKVVLPIQGGYDALASAGGTDAETVAPVIGEMPADITVSTANRAGMVVNYTPPTATDNEDPTPTVTCVKPSGSTFAVGQNTVVCTARDANGNESSKTFTINVLGLFDVGGAVPATLSLTLGAPANFGALTPGVTNTYTASTTATVTSSAGDALLSVADPSTTNTGHLTNGAFFLPQPLQARARNAANTGTPFNNVGSLLNLLTYSGPISNDAVSLEFSQLVNANDALRTGAYSKALTFTLSTTQP